MKNSVQKYILHRSLLLLFALYTTACTDQPENKNVKMDEVAGSEDVLNFMKTFHSLDELSEDSQPVSGAEALLGFRVPDDLSIDLVLSEPSVAQPLFMNFDHRGRLWVVQYNQYPFPAGLKIMEMDQYMRSKFDKDLLPPPGGVKGADKITIFEDTDGDGTFEKATDAITGLNLATSVANGRGHIWVLNPPFLLAYPDTDNDGIPDAPAIVHLKGFGIEDTHAVANNLRWGPDGWLYGAQGSTCTANVSSSVSKNIVFNGQALWRYHPQTRVFEIFAEGGGNTFDVEIDEKGRFYSGDNGNSRGQYYKQGGYFSRSLGKHGAFTNPYAFGYLEFMVNKGDPSRFTHAFIKYDGGSLPPFYVNRMIALNPLQRFVQLSRFEANGSTFSNSDERRIVETTDRWFRPVDIISGPDGGVYIADWYDSRLGHNDPRDTWSKTTGRIYRLQDKNYRSGFPKFDLSKYSNDELIELLSNANKWFRQMALQQLGDRKDQSAIPELLHLFKGGNGQVALEALWAINLSGGFDENVAGMGLHHADPFVRMWTVRLLGDPGEISTGISSQLVQIAYSETHPEVRSQLAATAKRLPGADAISLIKALLKNHDDSADPDIPLQLWWALECKAESHRDSILAMFGDQDIWNRPTIVKTILGRLMQRYVMAGGHANFKSCARLLDLAPTHKHAGLLIAGLQEGLRGRDVTQLSPELIKTLSRYQKLFREESLALDLRQGRKDALDKALIIIGDKNASLGERLAYVRILGEVNEPKAVSVLLELMESSESTGAIQQAALLSLQRYDQDDIGARVVKAYPNQLRADPDVRGAALALCVTRPAWAMQLLNAIDDKKQMSEKFVAHTIARQDIPDQIVWQLKMLNDQSITQTAERLWPDVRLATSPEKNATIARVIGLMRSGTGNLAEGRMVYMSKCGSCHRLFDEGGNIGPDLTGYDRTNLNDLLLSIVDPSAYIREGYVAHHITTVDGRTIVGTIKSRNGSLISFQPFSGDPVNISSNQVKDIEEQKTSIMPERLLDRMTDQQVKDMVSYLMKPSHL